MQGRIPAAGDLVRVDLSEHPSFAQRSVREGKSTPSYWDGDITHGMIGLIVHADQAADRASRGLDPNVYFDVSVLFKGDLSKISFKWLRLIQDAAHV